MSRLPSLFSDLQPISKGSQHEFEKKEDLLLILEENAKYLTLVCEIAQRVDDLSGMEIDWNLGDVSSMIKQLKSFKNRHNYISEVKGSPTLDEKIELLREIVADVQANQILKQRDEQDSMMQDDSLIENLFYDLAVTVSMENNTTSISPEDVLREALVQIEKKLKETPDAFGKRILENKELTADQLATLEQVGSYLEKEFKSRGEMLLKRLDVTLECLLDSPNAKNNKTDIKEIIQEVKKELSHFPISVYDALSATEQMLFLQERDLCKNNIAKQFLIGHVPDRGGRTNERAGRMPTWSKRSEESKRGGRGSYPKRGRKQRPKK